MSTVTSILSFGETRKARKADKKAAKIEAKRSKLEASRAAIGQVRKAQIARASVLQQGENQGAGTTTAVTGAVGAIQSQSGGNIAFAQQIFGLQSSAGRLRQSARTHRARASDYEAVGEFADKAAEAFSG